MTPWSRIERFIVRRALGTLTHVNTTEPLAALTFDDGPDPASTLPLLGVLEAAGARGTFFMLGRNARRLPDMVRRVVDGGHVVGHHTEDHPSLPMLPRAQRLRQMRLGMEALGPLATRFFRPPYGHQTLFTRYDAASLGFHVVAWDVVPIDWLDHSVDFMLARVAEKMRPGSILLLHDVLFDALDPSQADRSRLLALVQAILEEFHGQYRFVTVPELLRNGRPHYENWQLVGDREFMRQLSPTQLEV